MHKENKWAQYIIGLQNTDGKWGYFHSLPQRCDSPVTTEQALRRLERLGYTIEDDCIQKAVRYMDDCLTGKNMIPDRREKLHDWDVFTSLMLAAWIRRFTEDNSNANKIAAMWAEIITRAFADVTYDHCAYVSAYQERFGTKPHGGRLLDFVHFYPVSLLKGCLPKRTEAQFVTHILNHEKGIYYVYEQPLFLLPKSFESKEASQYLGAIELLSVYPSAKEPLRFVIDWLNRHKNANDKWDMGKNANDKVYFPLSNDWRKKTTRENDCTERIIALLQRLKN